jgi:hypothetical protein
LKGGRVTASGFKKQVVKAIEEAMIAKRAKALKVKHEQGERQAYYVVHEHDGLEEALNIVKGFKATSL